jgi:membrane-associated phospholipid phosphatase
VGCWLFSAAAAAAAAAAAGCSSSSGLLRRRLFAPPRPWVLLLVLLLLVLEFTCPRVLLVAGVATVMIGASALGALATATATWRATQQRQNNQRKNT